MGKDRKRNEAAKPRRTDQKRKKIIANKENGVAKRVKDRVIYNPDPSKGGIGNDEK